MSEFFSKYRTRLIAGGVVVVLGVLLKGLMGGSPTQNVADTAPPAVTSSVVDAVEALEEEEQELLMPPPFNDRNIDLSAIGKPPPSETAAYCNDSNWKRVDLLVEHTDDGVFHVDELAWKRTGLGSKAGLANWMSQCHTKGSRIEIVSAESGRRLAIYDPSSGLKTLL